MLEDVNEIVSIWVLIVQEILAPDTDKGLINNSHHNYVYS